MKQQNSLPLILIGVFISVVMGLLFLMNFLNGGQSFSKKPIISGEAPNFRLENLEHKQIELADLRGKPILINFWASWCSPCVEEMPMLEKIAQQYAGQMTVLAVNVEEDQQTVLDFMRDQSLSFPVLFDEQGMVSDLYVVQAFPSSYFVDAKGIVRAIHIGSLTEENIMRYIQMMGVQP